MRTTFLLLMLTGTMLGQRTSYEVKIAAECDQKHDHLGGCSASGCWCWHEPNEVSLSDVPAVLVKPKCAGGCVPPPEYWTCDDTRRILLTSENGERHCILFGK